MAGGAFITDSMRTRMNRMKRTAFNRMVKNSRQPTVQYIKYSGTNSVSIPSMGEVIPTFDSSVSVDALVEAPKIPQTRTSWGIDKRTQSKEGQAERVICMMCEDAKNLGVAIEDRFIVQSVDEPSPTEYHIAFIKPCTDMGHETWMVRIGLRKQTQSPR